MVLIVDDNLELSSRIKEDVLEMVDDITIDLAINVDQYMKIVQEKNIINYDVIVMDFNLEDRLDGIELLHKTYNAIEKFSEDAKIFFFTGNKGQMKNNDLKYLKEKKIDLLCKTEVVKIIDYIIDKFE